MAEASQDAAKRLAAARALDYVSSGMRLGLGTGTTAAFFVDALGLRVAEGLDIVGVPTSERTREQAARLGIPLTTLDETPELDLTVDGADEFDSGLRLIKGGGGAHLREKIVAASSKRMIVIADRSKYATRLGRFPLPVELVPFGLRSTLGRLSAAAEKCGCHGAIKLRQKDDGHAFVTDSGNAIADCAFGVIPDPEALAAALGAVPGVVEHGLFIGMATAIIVAGTDDIEVLGHPDR